MNYKIAAQPPPESDGSQKLTGGNWTINRATGEDILPAFFSDNYFSLMPGESKTGTVEFKPKYLKGGKPVFELSGWNTKAETINIR